ncbi:hypothetical protein AB0P00_15960 [Microbacterium sp. NPDC077057]|uniref:hypothetical protein n=1 Tax=Microbacterium sp. NPDC077057 TaxID=3154763 RepID=UPI00342D5F5F
MMRNFTFTPIAFAPDNAGWRLAVEWVYTDPQPEERDLDLYPIVGWVTEEEREELPPTDEGGAYYVATGTTRVLPAIFDPDGGYDVVSIARIPQIARQTSNLLRADYVVLAPGEPVPEGFTAFIR